MPNPANNAPDTGLPDQKQHILSAATNLFMKHGYEATDMRQVARAAGLSVGTLYNYFGGKDVLFSAALDNFWNQRSNRLLRDMMRANSWQERALCILEFEMTLARDYPVLWHELNGRGDRLPQAPGVLRHRNHAKVRWLNHQLQQVLRTPVPTASKRYRWCLSLTAAAAALVRDDPQSIEEHRLFMGHLIESLAAAYNNELHKPEGR